MTLRERERERKREEKRKRERKNVRKARVSVIKNASYKGREREKVRVSEWVYG